MRPIRIYFEGDIRLKPGLTKSLGDDSRVKVIAGKNKPETEKDFELGRVKHRDCLVLLLVDSDEPVPKASNDPCRFHMIEIMESWFLADRETLARHFGAGFKAAALPGNPARIESIPKRDVEQGLDNATRESRKRKYSYDKAGHGRDLLIIVDSAKVRKASPECERFFQALSL